MRLFLILLFCIGAILTKGQSTVGLQLNSAVAFDGYTLMAPTASDTTFLLDNCGHVVHTWTSIYKPGQAAYLLADGSLIRTGNVQNVDFTAGGQGGIIEKRDWTNHLTWSFLYSNSQYCTHHDIKVLPNGNIIAISWEKKAISAVLAAGRNPAKTGTDFWSDKIIEIQPNGPSSGTIVWEWHAWDHLIQHFDSTKSNYGLITQYPELIDLNFYNSTAADWLHANAIDYNPQLDQIILSSHNQNEIWIIDHSTTTAEAASHAGGQCGKGGDLLYRWGNPAAYKRGGPGLKKLFGQHDAQWI